MMKRMNVAVRFKETPHKDYHFLTDMEDLQYGDIVAVDTRHGISVAKVIEYVGKSDILSTNIAKWVVQKIDLSAHDKRMEKQKQLDEIRNKMEARRKELEEIQLFALLAKDDPSMKKLYDEFMEKSND